MIIKQEAGRRLKEARDKKGLTLREVCNQIDGLEISRLSNWEQGLNMIPVEEAKRLAPLLGTSAAYILTLDDEFDPRAAAMTDLYKRLGSDAKDRIFRAAEVECEYALKPEDNNKKSA